MNVSIVFLVRYVKHRHITERLRESIEIFNAHFKQRCYFLLGDVGDDQYSYFCVKTVPYLI